MPKGQRDGHSTLARSLPVTVPAFPSMIRRRVQDQDDDQVNLHVYLKTFSNCIYIIRARFLSPLVSILFIFFD